MPYVSLGSLQGLSGSFQVVMGVNSPLSLSAEVLSNSKELL